MDIENQQNVTTEQDLIQALIKNNFLKIGERDNGRVKNAKEPIYINLSLAQDVVISETEYVVYYASGTISRYPKL